MSELELTYKHVAALIRKMKRLSNDVIDYDGERRWDTFYPIMDGINGIHLAKTVFGKGDEAVEVTLCLTTEDKFIAVADKTGKIVEIYSDDDEDDFPGWMLERWVNNKAHRNCFSELDLLGVFLVEISVVGYRSGSLVNSKAHSLLTDYERKCELHCMNGILVRLNIQHDDNIYSGYSLENCKIYDTVEELMRDWAPETLE